MPKELVGKGLKANEWIGSVVGLFNGKGGGREEAGQVRGEGGEKIMEGVGILKGFVGKFV